MDSWDSQKGAALGRAGRAGQVRTIVPLQAPEGFTGTHDSEISVTPLPTPDLLPAPEALSSGAV